MPSNSSTKKPASVSSTLGKRKDEETVDAAAAAAAESPVSSPSPRCKHIQELFSTSTDLAQNFCELTQLFVDETHQKEFLDQRDNIRLISAKADGINLAQEMMRNFLHSPEASVTNCGSGLSSAPSTALPAAERGTNDSESVLINEAQSLANEARDRQKDLSLVLDKMVDNLSKCKEISSNLPDFNIPADLIQYIDSHKSPQLFSKQYLDDVYESNKNSMSKMLQFSLFRAKLMNEVFKIYPDEILKYKEKLNTEPQHGN